MDDREPDAEQNTAAPVENFLFNAKELQRLQDRVAASHGKVRIFVHPFFAGQDLTSPRYGDPLRKLLASTATDISPILVMEEYEKIEATKAVFEQHSSDQVRRNLFFVPTERATAVPHLPDTFQGTTPVGMWQLYIDKLTDAGVKQALVGGRDLSTTTYLDSHEIPYRGKFSHLCDCVGTYVEKLVQGFGADHVEISNIVAPIRRIDLIKG